MNKGDIKVFLMTTVSKMLYWSVMIYGEEMLTHRQIDERKTEVWKCEFGGDWKE